MAFEDFTKEFLNPVKINLAQEDLKKVLDRIYSPYNPPVYFNTQDTDNLIAEVEKFKKTSEFQKLLGQYQLLVHHLNMWCTNNKILKQQYGVEVFTSHFRLVFFDAMYKGREFLFFAEGKRCLENICALLENADIAIDKKKEVLLSLQESILVCADGTFDQIRRAKNEFLASTGSNALIQACKERLAEQIALSYNLMTNNEFLVQTNALTGMQIHYTNTYLNLIKENYGIDVTDKTTTSLNGKAANFKAYFAKMFNPNKFIDILIDKFTPIYTNLYADIKNKAFKNEVTSITSKELSSLGLQANLDVWNKQYADICPLNLYQFVNEINLLDNKFSSEAEQEAFLKELKNTYFAMHAAIKAECFHDKDLLTIADINANFPQALVDSWNNKYGHILRIEKENFLLKKLQENGSFLYELDSIDFNSFLNDVSLRYTLMPLNETLLTATIVSEFNNKKYLANPVKPILLAGNAENKDLKLYYNLEHYWVDNQGTLSKLTPQLFLKLHITTQDKEKDIIYWKIFNDLLQDYPQDQDLLLSTLGVTEIAKIAQAGMFPLLKLLIDNDLITQEHLQETITIEEGATVNLFWLLCYHNQAFLITQLINKPYFKLENLTQAPNKGYYAGTSALWFLAINKKFALIEQLLDKKLLTIKQLEKEAGHLEHTRPSILQCLCASHQFVLIEKLSNANLLPNEQFMLNPNRQKDAFMKPHDCPPLISLALAQKFNLLNTIVSNQKLSTAILEDEYGIEGYKINFLIMLLAAADFVLIAKLIEKDLLTPKQLLFFPNCPELQLVNTSPIRVISQVIPNPYLLNKLQEKGLITSFGSAVFVSTNPLTPGNDIAKEVAAILQKYENLELSLDNIAKAMRFACHCSYVDDLKVLIKSPLHYAIAKMSTGCVQVLIENGASTNIKDANGKTAIDLAKELNPKNIQILKLLNIKPETPAEAALWNLLVKNNIELFTRNSLAKLLHNFVKGKFYDDINILLAYDQTLIDCQDEEKGLSALEVVKTISPLDIRLCRLFNIQAKDESQAKLWDILQKYNLQEESCATITQAYRRAAHGNNAQDVEFLLNHDPSILNSQGPESKKTALHFAVEKKNQEIIDLLLKKGARQDLLDKDGNTVTLLLDREKLTQTTSTSKSKAFPPELAGKKPQNKTNLLLSIFAFLTPVISFATTAGIMLAVNAAVGTETLATLISALPFLTFLAPLGPIFGVLAFAAIIAALTLCIYASFVGIRALTVKPKPADDNPPTTNPAFQKLGEEQKAEIPNSLAVSQSLFSPKANAAANYPNQQISP